MDLPLIVIFGGIAGCAEFLHFRNLVAHIFCHLTARRAKRVSMKARQIVGSDSAVFINELNRHILFAKRAFNDRTFFNISHIFSLEKLVDDSNTLAQIKTES